MPHNYADPDALAAALAIEDLLQAKEGISSTISFEGVVGREENKAMCRHLGIETEPTSKIDFDDFDLIALIDCQPGGANNALPEERRANIVIDHHPIDSRLDGVAFADIRSDVGASATIATEYLIDAGVPISSRLATALVYGIKTDALNLAIKTKESDIKAYLHLFPLADKALLNKIESAQLPREYFSALSEAIGNAEIYDHTLLCDLKEVENPGVIGEFADLFLRIDSIETSLCFGVYSERLMMSIRTLNTELHAGRIIKTAIGARGTAGGHAAMAGGQIPLTKETAQERKAHIQAVREKVLHLLAAKDKKGGKVALCT